MLANIAVENVIFVLGQKEIQEIKRWDLQRKLQLCRGVRTFSEASKRTDFAISETTFLRFWDQLNAMVQLRYDDYVGHSHLHCVMAFLVTDKNLPSVWSVLCPASSFFADYLLELCDIVEPRLATTISQGPVKTLHLPLLK